MYIHTHGCSVFLLCLCAVCFCLFCIYCLFVCFVVVRQVDSCFQTWSPGRRDGQTDRRTDGQTDRRTDAQWTHSQTNGYYNGFLSIANWPMKSEPPTPTRASDNQFRKMQDSLNCIRHTSLLNFWGWGRGVPIPSAIMALMCSAVLHSALLHLTLLCSALLVSSTLFYSLLLSTTLFYSLLLSSTLFYSLLLSSTLFWSLPISSVAYDVFLSDRLWTDLLQGYGCQLLISSVAYAGSANVCEMSKGGCSTKSWLIISISYCSDY